MVCVDMGKKCKVLRIYMWHNIMAPGNNCDDHFVSLLLVETDPEVRADLTSKVRLRNTT